MADGEDGETARFEPGETVKLRGSLLFPDARRMDAPFWKPLQEHWANLDVTAVYRFRPQVELTGEGPRVHVDPREPEELTELKRWRDAKFENPVEGPTPNDFGVPYKSKWKDGWLFDAATQQISGQLSDPFSLGVRLQGIYASPDEERENKIRDLLAWLRAMPDLKREVLTEKARAVAERYHMRAAAEALAER
jgi:hypothetical protein